MLFLVSITNYSQSSCSKFRFKLGGKVKKTSNFAFYVNLTPILFGYQKWRLCKVYFSEVFNFKYCRNFDNSSDSELQNVKLRIKPKKGFIQLYFIRIVLLSPTTKLDNVRKSFKSYNAMRKSVVHIVYWFEIFICV